MLAWILIVKRGIALAGTCCRDYGGPLIPSTLSTWIAPSETLHLEDGPALLAGHGFSDDAPVGLSRPMLHQSGLVADMIQQRRSS